MTTLTITLPWPATALRPNGFPGRRAFIRAKMAARLDGWGAAMEAMQFLGAEWWRHELGRGPLRLAVTFTYPNRIKRDRDGDQAALKHQCDGIAQALGVDDVSFRPVYFWSEEPKRPGGVMIVIEEEPSR